MPTATKKRSRRPTAVPLVLLIPPKGDVAVCWRGSEGHRYFVGKGWREVTLAELLDGAAPKLAKPRKLRREVAR